MKITTLFVILLTLLTLGITACTKPRAGYYNRPIRTSAEVATATADTNYVGNGPDARRRKLIFKTLNEQRIVLDPGQVWGYETRSGQRYRHFNRQYYQVLELSPLSIYSQTNSFYDGTSMQTTIDYFFSRTPEAPIFPLRKRFLREQFADNPTFVRLINTRRQRIFNRKTKRFYLNEWYQEVQNR